MGRETGITGELDVQGDQPPGLPPPDALIVTTDRLTKTYGPRDAVRDLSIGVQTGEVYGLLGPNGAGKTTTLRVLLGLVRPTSGSATICDARPGSPEALARVGALVEEPALYPYLSGRDNLRVLARYSKVAKARIAEVLELVGLTPRAGDKVRTYSLGMRQRLGVAAALLKDPEVLILDEPTNGLDPQGMAQMRSLIRQLGSGERTVLLSSHLLGEVEQVCDRVGVIREGTLVAQAPVSQLRGAQVLHIVAHPVDRALAVLERSGDVKSASISGDTIAVNAPVDAAAALNTALVEQGVAVSRLGVNQRSLEDVFLDITGDDHDADGTTATTEDTTPATTAGEDST
jgi:ABC-2 type transport system ATP-binding protein